MSFTRNTLLSAIFTFGTLAVVAHDTQACPPSRSGGYSRGYSSHSYSQPSYNSYSTPSYNYSQPTYNSYSQPVQVIRQVQPVQSVQPQQFVQQQTPIQSISQSQPVAPQQQFAQQPQQQQQVAPQQQVVPQQQVAPQQPQGNPAAMSALQALGGFAPPQTAAPQQQQPLQVQVPAHVGNWTASLGNGSSVRLNLRADGNFTWVATNKSGGTSSFSGNYTVSDGSLNLNRSNDNQQLGGSMTSNGNNAFSFKVAGNNAASIDFQRS